MFYKFSQIAGRMIKGPNAIGKPVPQLKNEVGVIYSPTEKFPKIPSPTIKLNERLNVAPGYYRIKEVQKKFQKDDGIPIHLKRGWPDELLLCTTYILCGLGLWGTFSFMYESSFPEKKDEC